MSVCSAVTCVSSSRFGIKERSITISLAIKFVLVFQIGDECRLGFLHHWMGFIVHV